MLAHYEHFSVRHFDFWCPYLVSCCRNIWPTQIPNAPCNNNIIMLFRDFFFKLKVVGWTSIENYINFLWNGSLRKHQIWVNKQPLKIDALCPSKRKPPSNSTIPQNIPYKKCDPVNNYCVCRRLSDIDTIMSTS